MIKVGNALPVEVPRCKNTDCPIRENCKRFILLLGQDGAFYSFMDFQYTASGCEGHIPKSFNQSNK